MLGIGIGIPRMSRVGLRVGDTYQGGIVFYVSGSSGLISSASDQSSAQWGCQGTNLSGAAGTDIGTGAQNTIDINAGCTTANIAADVCRDLDLNGYTDWFLPSKDELNQMYIHRATIGNFTTGNYWSSSEAGPGTAWLQVFNTGSQVNTTGKSSALVFRAIRAF
tara:strand:- start:84 stop:575 length:492 start_codon:yes stop_codon:yes gene_type:complete